MIDSVQQEQCGLDLLNRFGGQNLQRGFESPLSARFLLALESRGSAWRFKRVIAPVVYPRVIPTAENFSRLDVSQPECHQWTAAANLIDLPKLLESPRDRFGSSAECYFIGATVRETVRLERSRG